MHTTLTFIGNAPAKITYEVRSYQHTDDGSWYCRFGEQNDSYYNERTTYSFDTEQQALVNAGASCCRLLGLDPHTWVDSFLSGAREFAA